MAQSSFQFESGSRAALDAARLALPVRRGHFDELRNADGRLRPMWQRFFDTLGDDGAGGLDRMQAAVTRQIRDNGTSYNVYSDADGTARPWALDLLPLLIDQHEWRQIARGAVQRAHLLNAVMADVYGPRRLLARGLLPPALVFGNPGYLRPMHGLEPPAGVWLHLLAFDLARGPDGLWWIVGSRTQAPSGLGYALENRLTIGRSFADAFRTLGVQRLAGSFRRLLDALSRLAPGGGSSPRLVLLTPGPYNETYFEHAYLARYLGLPLVEGGDLTVRDDCVYLKTVDGLQRVHGILRRLDDDFCDPLELRSDSALGVPGLLQAMRRRNVLVANAPGSAFLESPAIAGFLPPIAQAMGLGELALPALPTWWCGEAAARVEVLGHLGESVIKPTWPGRQPGRSFEPVLGTQSDAATLAAWRARIEADPEAYTVQTFLPLSQAPVWREGALQARAAMLRVYALADGEGGWSVLPGGLTRIASGEQAVVSMQRGGSSLDTWVQTGEAVDGFSLLPTRLRPEDLAARHARPVTSRAAENLFWMGRYAERADNAVRLARIALPRLGSEDSALPALAAALAQLCERHGLVPAGVPSPLAAPALFERTLVAGLADPEEGVMFTLLALQRAAEQIRDRLSPEHWRLIAAAVGDFERATDGLHPAHALATADAQSGLAQLAERLAAITGAQADRMTRDVGWTLLAIGRQVERLSTMATTLGTLFAGDAIQHESGFDLLLGLADSTITYRALYQRRLEVPALVDLVVLDADNPRALACIADELRRALPRLPPGPDGHAGLLGLLPPAGIGIDLGTLCERDGGGRHPRLSACALLFAEAAAELSDEVGRRHFSHARDTYRTSSAWA